MKRVISALYADPTHSATMVALLGLNQGASEADVLAALASSHITLDQLLLLRTLLQPYATTRSSAPRCLDETQLAALPKMRTLCHRQVDSACAWRLRLMARAVGVCGGAAGLRAMIDDTATSAGALLLLLTHCGAGVNELYV